MGVRVAIVPLCQIAKDRYATASGTPRDCWLCSSPREAGGLDYPLSRVRAQLCLFNAYTNGQPGRADVWYCYAMRNVTPRLLSCLTYPLAITDRSQLPG